MTKAQKSLFKSLKKDAHRDGFIEMLIAQQNQSGSFEHWREAYLKKLKKKSVKPKAFLMQDQNTSTE